MSDIILKFWPKEANEENQTDLIKAQFEKDNITSGETEHWGKPALKSGENLGEMIGVSNQIHLKQLKIQIEAKGYGVEEGEEDFEYIDRNNLICIQNADGDINNWSKFEEYLTKITGKEYKGGWELL